MRLQTGNRKDILAGIAFIAIALGAAFVARDYRIGTPARMGKGFMPMILCTLLGILGVATLCRGFVVRDLDPVTLAWRPLLLVVIGFALFGLTVERFGFVIASVLMIGVSSFAMPKQRMLQTMATAVVLIVLCTLIFVVALGLPIPVWPRL